MRAEHSQGRSSPMNETIHSPSTLRSTRMCFNFQFHIGGLWPHCTVYTTLDCEILIVMCSAAELCNVHFSSISWTAFWRHQHQLWRVLVNFRVILHDVTTCALCLLVWVQYIVKVWCRFFPLWYSPYFSSAVSFTEPMKWAFKQYKILYRQTPGKWVGLERVQ